MSSWYIRHGDRIDDARKSLSRVRDTEQEVEDEILAIREAITFEKEVISSSYLALWKDVSVRKRLLLAFVINIGQQLSGQGTLNSYSSTIYKKVWTSLDKINLINALNATMGIIFTLNATWTVDRFGRKFLLIVGACGMACCMLIVPIIGMETPNTAAGGKQEPVGIAIVAMLFLFIFFYKPSWGATVWIWTSEVFSMNVRVQAVGMVRCIPNLFAHYDANRIKTVYPNAERGSMHLQPVLPNFLQELRAQVIVSILGSVHLTSTKSLQLLLHDDERLSRNFCVVHDPRNQGHFLGRNRRSFRWSKPYRKGSRPFAC